jgi:hypothetical protein
MIDREYQKGLLQKLYEKYPLGIATGDIYTELDEQGQNKFLFNIKYLEEHGLVKSGVNITHTQGGGHVSLGKTSITHKGIDFLVGDDGLSAILNVVTVKFEEDTLKALIEANINNTKNLTPEDKKGLIARLRSLPADAIKHLTLKLLEKGLASAPDIIQTIETYVRHNV